MFLGDLIRSFWGGTISVLHHLNPFDNAARHPTHNEPMEVDDESFDLKGPAYRTRSAPGPPSPDSPINRRSYQPHPALERKPAITTSKSSTTPSPTKTELGRRPLNTTTPSTTSPSRLSASPILKPSTSSTSSPVRNIPITQSRVSPAAATTSRKPGSAATPHPAKSLKRNASPPTARGTASPTRAYRRKSISPPRKVASAISLRTRSRSRGRPHSPIKEAGETGEEPIKVKKLSTKKVPAKEKLSAKKSALKGEKIKKKQKSAEVGAVKRSRRAQQGDLESPTEKSPAKVRKASSSSGPKKVKKVKI